MQIHLTKKLANAMKLKPESSDEEIHPLFCWTANWTNTFDGRKEDMIIMVNHATRFTVAIYGIKSNQFKNIETKMIDGIRNTLLAMNLNAELVDEYMKLAGNIRYASNHDRKMTAQVNRQGLETAFLVGRFVMENEGKIKFEDTFGRLISQGIVNCGGSVADSFFPAEEMIKALVQLTGKAAYNCRVFELLVTLDLEIYKATRRLMVPADIGFDQLHLILQQAFEWRDDHLYDFTIVDSESGEVHTRLVPDKESLSWDDKAVLLTGKRLSQYFPQHKRIIYTYDMGDDWRHEIELVQVIEQYNEEVPFLLEARGKTPPEDVGGIPGFLGFREILLDQTHPKHGELKRWAGYWSPELTEWEARPKGIRC